MVSKSRIVQVAIAAVLLSASLYAQNPHSNHAYWMVSYYEGANNIEPVSAIPWDMYDVVIHFAVTTDANANILLHYLTQDQVNEIVAAGHKAGKKVTVCIQDNGKDRTLLGKVTAPALINTFVTNIVNFVNSNGYDGVDMDWESNVNATQYAQLFQLLRAAMPGKLITTAMTNNSNMVAAAGASVAYVDQFNMMCYDMDTPANGWSWYNDALFQSGNANEMTCDWRVKPMLGAGVPPSKIVIGMPFYGRLWEGVTQANVTGLFNARTVLYRDLVTDPTRWQTQYQGYDDRYQSNYLSIPPLNEFASYNGAEEIDHMAHWIKAQGFGGAMTYSLYYEYLPNEGGDARYPLSSVLYHSLFDLTVPATPPIQPPGLAGK